MAEIQIPSQAAKANTTTVPVNVEALAQSAHGAGIATGAHQAFIERMRDWNAAIPSANLWTVEIFPHQYGAESVSSTAQLLVNIMAANTRHNLNLGSIWRVDDKFNGGNIAKNPLAYLGQTGGVNIGMFYANSISFSNNSVSINDGISGDNIPHGGFLQFGKVATNKNQALQARISFMCSNVDINDILIDRWISAIAQQGLIEDASLPNIKADIFLTCYSASVPGVNKEERHTSWVPRKQYKLYKCFPISREQNQFGYEKEDAFMKYQVVDFSIQTYTVQYFVVSPNQPDKKNFV